MSNPKIIPYNPSTTEPVIGESITINKTIPSKQFNEIFVTETSVEDQQTIVDFKRNHVELNLREYGHIKIEPDVITYNGKIYAAIDSLNPTIEECIKKWEEKGWKWETKGGVYYVSNKDNDNIEFCQERKGCIFCGEIGISIELIELIHKTLKALEVKDE